LQGRIILPRRRSPSKALGPIRGLRRGAAEVIIRIRAKKGRMVAHFVGPRMYYSILGLRGLGLGAKARLLKRQIEVDVKHPDFPHPIHLRLRTTDVALCKEILIRQQYECVLAQPPRVIVDGGANIGLASVFFAHRYPDARVIAIEPESSNYAMLLKNTAPYPNIVAMRAALWNRDTELDLVDLGSGHTTFQTAEPATDMRGSVISKVAAITVDRLMDELGINAIDLLKLDIEGAEKELFEGPLAWTSRVGVIAVELHEHMRPGLMRSVSAAMRPFEESWTRGEVTFFARKGLASETLDGGLRESMLPLRILSAR
jgi:FkbM family methyltransferase